MAVWQERAELLFKPEGIEVLKKANVLIVGLGGVGSFAAEFIVRAGVGNLTIVDGDTVDITNVNRQLPALHSTVGRPIDGYKSGIEFNAYSRIFIARTCL